MSSDASDAHVRTSAWVIWRNRDGGVERFRLEQAGGENRLNGVVITPFDGRPAEIRYLVTANDRWETTSCHVVINEPHGTRRFHLLVRDGSWTDAEGREVESLRGCVDADLMCTPATNTLVIRRLTPPAGETVEVRAAWVRFPGLNTVVAPQRYTNLGDKRWRYESDTFSAELTVDSDGLVIDYADIWTSVSRWRRSQEA